MTARLAPELVERGWDLRQNGLSWNGIAKRLGCSYETIRRRLDPEYQERRNLTQAERQERMYPSRIPGTLTVYGVGSAGIPSFRPPPEVIAERDQCLSQPTTLTMRICGDPLPGRSALDQRRENRP